MTALLNPVHEAAACKAMINVVDGRLLEAEYNLTHLHLDREQYLSHFAKATAFRELKADLAAIYQRVFET